MPDQENFKVPKNMQPRYEEIVGLTDAFCKKHLNDEYATLCRKMTAKISRKRPSQGLGWGNTVHDRTD